METLLTHTDKPVIFTAWSVNQIIDIAEAEGENLDMTPADILSALRFAAVRGDDAHETHIVETVKEAHKFLNRC